MNDIVRLSLEDLDDFLESLTIYFPDDNIKREDWIELLEDEKTVEKYYDNPMETAYKYSLEM